jgi:beta-glucosidase
LYVTAVNPGVPRPLKELRGFERVPLAPGEQKRVTFRVKPADAFAWYDERRRQFAVDAGEYDIAVGASSRDIRLTTRLSVR